MTQFYSLANVRRQNRPSRSVLSSYLAIFISLVFATQTLGQTTDSSKIQDHLDSGEYPIAIVLANGLKPDDRDQWLAKIAQSQMDAGAGDAAYSTAELVVYDSTRAEALNQLSDSRFGRPDGMGGRAGGITILDFRNLIDLIQNTVAVDSWEDTGTGLGTIQAFPSGVYVDPSGTMKRIRTTGSKKTGRFRDVARRDSGNRVVASSSEMRKISLTRLEKMAQSLAAQGKPIDATMKNLAGIYEIKYLMMYPETGDIVIAGPAGPWKLNGDSRPVNVETGKPVLQLDDFVVCLRNAWEKNGIFGCSIDPQKENLAKAMELHESGAATGNRWAEKVRETLGKQDVVVFGIDPETHTARVVVEADYRMKLVGMGLEPSIPEVPSYFDRVKLNANGEPPATDLMRWWFTLNYDDIVVNENRTVFAFHGTGVQVQSENEFLDDQGDRVHTGKSNKATKGFARDFTVHFDKLADKYPVYRQMKNVFDLALVTNLIRQQELAQKTSWHQTFFHSPVPGSLAYVVHKEKAPLQVDSVMIERIIRNGKKSPGFKIAGISGGVMVNVNDVISKELVVDKKGGELEQRIESDQPQADDVHWWWD